MLNEKKKRTSTLPHYEISTERATTTQIPPNRQWKHQQSLNRVLEETRDKIRKSVDEARNHIPRYAEIVNDYQEQAIQAAREI
jgi:hypothetical protein